MKILLLNGNTDSGLTAGLAAKAELALARMGVAGVELVPATARFGARYISTRATATIAGHAVLDTLAQRVGTTNAEGFNAVAIACFGDPGLDAAKELCPIPVTGMAEASLAVAMRRAPRVAFLTGGEAWVPMLEEFCLLRGYGREHVIVRAVRPTGDMIARDPDVALALLAETAHTAINAGAEAVVLGGAGLAGLSGLLAPALPVPVLDSLDCVLEEALRLALAPPPTQQPHPPTPTLHLAPALAALLGGGAQAG